MGTAAQPGNVSLASAVEDLGHLDEVVGNRLRLAAAARRRRAARARSGRACRATIWPKAPSCTASMAAMPNRVASTRSKAVGVPPRCTWPRIVTRDSNPVRLLDLAREQVRDPAEALVTVDVDLAFGDRDRPGLWDRPFGDDDDRGPAPDLMAVDETAQIESMSKGSSGMMISAAPPAMPA